MTSLYKFLIVRIILSITLKNEVESYSTIELILLMKNRSKKCIFKNDIIAVLYELYENCNLYKYLSSV